MTDSLSERIKQARLDAGLSREQVAAGIGSSLATVVRMETGRTRRISTERISALSSTTGKPVAWFFGTTEAA